MKRETASNANNEIPVNKIQLPAENEANNAENGELWVGPSTISWTIAIITPIMIAIMLINKPPAAILTSMRFLYFSSISLTLKMKCNTHFLPFLNNTKKNIKRKNNPAKIPAIKAIWYPNVNPKKDSNFPVGMI